MHPYIFEIKGRCTLQYPTSLKKVLLLSGYLYQLWESENNIYKTEWLASNWKGQKLNGDIFLKKNSSGLGVGGGGGVEKPILFCMDCSQGNFVWSVDIFWDEWTHINLLRKNNIVDKFCLFLRNLFLILNLFIAVWMHFFWGSISHMALK